MRSRGDHLLPYGWKALSEHLFSAFAVRDFRWLWGFNFLAALGMATEMLTTGWLVLVLTDSPFSVGAVFGLRGLGVLVFGAMGGVLADWRSRRQVLAVAQGVRALLLMTLGLLVVAERIELWHVLLVAPLVGATQATVLPTNNSLIYDTVGPRHLLNAMAARLIAFNGARLLGSLMFGFLLSTVGVGACYLVIAAAVFISPLPLLFMKVQAAAPRPREPLLGILLEGLRYAAHTGHLRTLLLLSMLMEGFGFSYSVLLPVMARDVLEVGATGLGLLSASASVGAVVGTLAVGSLGNYQAKGRILVLTSGGAGLCLLLFGASPWFPLSLVLVAFVGGTIMAYDATMATLLQLLTPDALRGRVMGLYGLTFGFTPMGGFLSGALAAAVSAPFAIGVGGLVIVAYGLGVLGWREFVGKGLLPVGRIASHTGDDASTTAPDVPDD